MSDKSEQAGPRQPVVAHAPRRPEIDWRVNITSIGTLLVAVLAGGMWVGGIDGRVQDQAAKIASLERANDTLLTAINQLQIQVAVQGAQAEKRDETLQRIEETLARLLRSMRAPNEGEP